MLTCQQVADYLLYLDNFKLDDEPVGDISNLKLQKLVYYCQGFSLALHNVPMFQEDIEAWPHGPVVRSLYEANKQYGADVIPCPNSFDAAIYSLAQKTVIEEVYKVYSQFSPWKLRELTHTEPPWLFTSNNGKTFFTVITHDTLKNYFVTQLEDEET
jgi:uncharacterized phage-associated protein